MAREVKRESRINGDQLALDGSSEESFAGIPKRSAQRRPDGRGLDRLRDVRGSDPAGSES
jgi:hypothetical protein